ncbi:MAG: hypothetical protein ACYC1E_17695 [Propionibacteriaceae bacterium]
MARFAQIVAQVEGRRVTYEEVTGKKDVLDGREEEAGDFRKKDRLDQRGGARASLACS